MKLMKSKHIFQSCTVAAVSYLLSQLVQERNLTPPDPAAKAAKVISAHSGGAAAEFMTSKAP